MPDITPSPAKDSLWLRQQAISTTFATVEILAGRRPMPQLKGRVTAPLLALIHHVRGEGYLTGARLRSLRIQSPRRGVMEISIRVHLNNRSHAIALRFEERFRWICTDLETALPIGENRSLVQIDETFAFPPPKYEH